MAGTFAKDRHARDLWSDRASSERPRLVALKDEAAQANWVADDVLRKREEGIQLTRQAVLFRTASHSAPPGFGPASARRLLDAIAKGQEWQSVHVLNVVDGCMPSDMSTGTSEQIEEERRLLYVAMTRAKQHLALLTPQRYYLRQQHRTGDAHVYATPSRFIPGRVARMFEQVVPAMAASHGIPVSAEPPVDVGAKVRGMWD